MALLRIDISGWSTRGLARPKIPTRQISIEYMTLLDYDVGFSQHKLQAQWNVSLTNSGAAPHPEARPLGNRLSGLKILHSNLKPVRRRRCSVRIHSLPVVTSSRRRERRSFPKKTQWTPCELGLMNGIQKRKLLLTAGLEKTWRRNNVNRLPVGGTNGAS